MYNDHFCLKYKLLHTQQGLNGIASHIFRPPLKIMAGKRRLKFGRWLAKA
jgi:hypothetical protein